MITKKQKTILAHLTGRVPLEMKEDLKDGVPVPTDSEIKNLICILPNDYLHAIHIGPAGDRFKELVNEAIERIAAQAKKNAKPSWGRVASAGVVNDLEPHEIGVSDIPFDPSKK
jgi:hypothetical protein